MIKIPLSHVKQAGTVMLTQMAEFLHGLPVAIRPKIAVDCVRPVDGRPRVSMIVRDGTDLYIRDIDVDGLAITNLEVLAELARAFIKDGVMLAREADRMAAMLDAHQADGDNRSHG